MRMKTEESPTCNKRNVLIHLRRVTDFLYQIELLLKQREQFSEWDSESKASAE